MFSSVGLTNKSVDPLRQRLCALNCVLQLLCSIPLFRETLLRKVTPPSAPSNNNFPHPVFALQSVLQQMKMESAFAEQIDQWKFDDDDEETEESKGAASTACATVVNSKIIIDSIPDWSLDSAPTDLEELFCNLRDIWTSCDPKAGHTGETKLAVKIVRELFDLIFSGVRSNVVEAANPEQGVPYLGTRIEELASLSLPVAPAASISAKTPKSLADLYDVCVAPERLEGSNGIRVPDPQNAGSTKTIDVNIQTRLNRLPPVLINYLKRFEVDFSMGFPRQVLSRNPISFPQTFDASSYEKKENRFEAAQMAQTLIADARRDLIEFGSTQAIPRAEEWGARLIRQENFFPDGAFLSKTKNDEEVESSSIAKYELFAVAGYQGDGVTFGHYTLRVKSSENSWTIFDDEQAPAKKETEEVLDKSLQSSCVWIVYVRAGCSELLFKELNE